ncbi:MAG: hypothetical protein R2746_00875 [Acidimicrobiales bacterium]
MATADVAVHDVQAAAVVELGVLEAFGRIELAVGARRLGEDLGERAQDVVVVVEHLVVVAVDTCVALDEDLRRRVDHDLPDVVVGEERGERAVPGEFQIARWVMRSGSGRSDGRTPRL